MKSAQTFLLNFVLLILCFDPLSYSQAASNSQGDPYEGWETFSQEDYAIRYPADWTITPPSESPDEAFSIDASFPTEIAELPDRLYIGLNMITDSSANFVNLEDLSPAQLDEYVEALTGLLSETSKTWEVKAIDNPAGRYLQLIYVADEGDGVVIKAEQRIWIRNYKCYTLTFGGMQNAFDRHREIGEKILDSFRLNPSASPERAP
ncbi:MAG: hypothetical protein LBU46_04720 [Candidatus Accumulibacter sp.]|jgi:hypothetical protein|nr:hypothetical protein [Accumulibacter sp.]